jgi:hypothetical protein
VGTFVGLTRSPTALVAIGGWSMFTAAWSAVLGAATVAAVTRRQRVAIAARITMALTALLAAPARVVVDLPVVASFSEFYQEISNLLGELVPSIVVLGLLLASRGSGDQASPDPTPA